VFNGIQFQPLDKNTYLRVQCFINQLEASIPQVLYSILLYNDALVWFVSWIQVRYFEGLLFRKSTIPTNPKAIPNPKLNPNDSTVAHICTMDFWNSGPLE